jgi:hypothetical protein
MGIVHTIIPFSCINLSSINIDCSFQKQIKNIKYQCERLTIDKHQKLATNIKIRCQVGADLFGRNIITTVI